MYCGTTITILRTSVRKANAVPLPPEQEFVRQKKRLSARLTVVQPVVLQPGSQAWVIVKSKRRGLVLIESDGSLFEKHNCAAATGVHQIKEGGPFGILVANFGNHRLQLLSNQTISRVEDLSLIHI